MSKKQRIRAAAAALAMGALSAVLPSAAHAVQDDGNSTCVVLDYCAYTGTSFSGSVWTWFGDDNIWPSVITNKEDSVWNRSSTYTVRVYDGTGFSTYIYCTPPNSSYGSMGVNNRGSSQIWNGGC